MHFRWTRTAGIVRGERLCVCCVSEFGKFGKFIYLYSVNLGTSDVIPSRHVEEYHHHTIPSFDDSAEQRRIQHTKNKFQQKITASNSFLTTGSANDQLRAVL